MDHFLMTLGLIKEWYYSVTSEFCIFGLTVNSSNFLGTFWWNYIVYNTQAQKANNSLLVKQTVAQCLMTALDKILHVKKFWFDKFWYWPWQQSVIRLAMWPEETSFAILYWKPGYWTTFYTFLLQKNRKIWFTGYRMNSISNGS